MASNPSPANWMILCQDCLRIVREHDDLARRMNWRVPLGVRPEVVDAMYRTKWAALTADGSRMGKGTARPPW